MAQPTSTSKQKKKKIPKKPSLKQQARDKHLKRLEEFKSRVDKPQLNTIGTPSGIQKVKGKKKGKKFVNESTTSLLAIVAEVNEKNDSEIKSKLQRARELETIREAKQRENESRAESKKARMEKAKETLKTKKRKAKDNEDA